MQIIKTTRKSILMSGTLENWEEKQSRKDKKNKPNRKQLRNQKRTWDV